MLQHVKNLKRLRRVLWIIVLFLLLLIFVFSSQSGEESSDTSGKITRFVVRMLYADFDELPANEQQLMIEKWNFVIRKGAHFTEYAVLAFSVCLLLYTYPLKKRALLSWLIATAYAATDEMHQLMVADRSSSIWDVLLDSSGALVGMLLSVWLIYRWRKKHTEERK